ncbi:MAG: hypothetical protein HYV62_13665 [Candidatus Rokubacteria bacterium]|nr:hypothetical protein [Candidatus Rokubacteria bacterium]
MRHVVLVNSYLYVCAFAANRREAGQLWVYTDSSDWALYFHPVDDLDHFALRQRRLYGNRVTGGQTDWVWTALFRLEQQVHSG